MFNKDAPQQFHNVAAMIPGKTLRDVIMKYKELEYDVSNIEAALVPIFGYTTSTFALDGVNGHNCKLGRHLVHINKHQISGMQHCPTTLQILSSFSALTTGLAFAMASRAAVR